MSTTKHTFGLAVLLACGLSLTTPLPAQSEAEEPAPPPTLAEAAAQADLVALVQVLDTDYETVRDFPTGGTAFLRVLIPYKVTRPLPDLVEVYEEGLHDHECYFPTPGVSEEGRRYLVFLRVNPDREDQYRGLAHGCALEVLVLQDNRYVLRYPLAPMPTSDDPAEAAQPRAFQDSYALFADEDMSVDERNRLLDGNFLERTDEGFRFTHGVDLSAVRALIGTENLTLDRQLRLVPDPVVIEE